MSGEQYILKVTQFAFRAVIEHQTEAFLDSQQPILGKLDSFNALNAWRELIIDLQIERNCQGGCPIGSWVSELAETEPEARTQLVASFARWEAAIRTGLCSMHARVELRDEAADPDGLALAAYGLQVGLPLA